MNPMALSIKKHTPYYFSLCIFFRLFPYLSALIVVEGERQREKKLIEQSDTANQIIESQSLQTAKNSEVKKKEKERNEKAYV